MKTPSDSSTEPVDPRARVQQAALEINRLHAEVVRLTTESKQSLASAVAVAWQAGHLLLAEKKRVRQTCGAAWLFWLEHNFKGAPRTAQRYMWLAQSEPDVSRLEGLSLRQAYFRLGLATEHKSPAGNRQVRSFPQHILLTGKLLVALHHAMMSAACRRNNARPTGKTSGHCINDSGLSLKPTRQAQWRQG